MRRIALIAALLLAVNGAAGAEKTPAAAAKPAPAPIDIALHYLRQGELDEAEARFRRLENDEDEATRTEARFELGMIAVVRRDYRRAIQIFLDLLATRPGLARVRLELARAYFLDENYSDAAFHFQFVMADKELPEEVRANVMQYIEAARRQKSWVVALSFGLAPDTNRNSASGTSRCIMSVFGPMCDTSGPSHADSGIGLKLNASVNHYWRWTKNWGLRSTAAAFITKYEGRDYDDNTLYGASGPRYIFGDGAGEASVQATYTKRWLYDERYSYGPGVRADTNWTIAKQWAAAAGWSITDARYDDEATDAALRGYTRSYYLMPRYVIDNLSFANLEFGYARDRPRMEDQRTRSRTYGAGYFREFSLGFSAGVNASVTNIKYDGLSLFMSDTEEGAAEDWESCEGDWFLCYKPRRAKIYATSLTLNSNKWNWHGLFPSLKYSYITRKSDFKVYEYDRHRLEMLMNVRF